MRYIENWERVEIEYHGLDSEQGHFRIGW